MSDQEVEPPCSTSIASILGSSGPVVKCVLLRTAQKKRPPNQNVADIPEPYSAGGTPEPSGDSTSTPSGDNEQREQKSSLSADENDTINGVGTSITDTKQQYPLVDLVEEIELDTTPAKNKVAQLLGGTFTFLGQYEEEGIVLMARRAWVEDDLEEGHNRQQQEAKQLFDEMSIKQLRSLATKWDVCIDNIVEKQELVTALKKKELELPLINPHPLQPPLQNLRVRGDILVMKVAAVDDELDESKEGTLDFKNDKDGEEGEGGVDDGSGPSKEQTNAPLHVPSNEEFFLDYTKDEYLAFATRTDVLPPPQRASDSSEEEQGEEDGAIEEQSDEGSDDKNLENGGDGDDDDDDDDDYQLAEDMEEMTEEEEKSAMLNIVMSELLRKFREENGRGPDTRELLEIRASVAEQLGVEVATFDEAHAGAEEDSNNQDEGTNGRKRKADSDAKAGDEGDILDEPNAKRVSFDSNLVSEHNYEYNSENDNGHSKVEEHNETAGEKETGVRSKDMQQQNGGNEDEDEDGKPPAFEDKQQQSGDTDDEDGKPPAE